MRILGIQSRGSQRRLSPGPKHLWCLLLLLPLLGACTISKQAYRANLTWTPVPASDRIELTALVQANCELSEESQRTWKRFGNTEASIVNFNQAVCDAMTEDMSDSRLFRRVAQPGEQKYDVLLKLASMQSPGGIRVTLSVIDPKSRKTLTEYKGTRPIASSDYSDMNVQIPKLLADLREQMLDDFGDGKPLAQLVPAKNRPAVPAAQVASAVPQVPAVTLSDVDRDLPAARSRKANAYAVVIGIEQYRQNLPRADFAVHDAKTVTEYLTKVLGYPEENVVTLTNDRALKSDMTKYFEKWLPNQVEPGASVFVYYSGHGAPNPSTGDAYLVPYDGDPSYLDATGYPLKRLYDTLAKLPAKQVVVALDSCFSGAGGRSVIAKGTRSISLNLKQQAPPASNLTILAASSGAQTSSTYDAKGHGLFTYFLLKGIKNEDVVAPDGSLRLDDLFGYLEPQVERVARKEYNNEQTPQWIGAGRQE